MMQTDYSIWLRNTPLQKSHYFQNNLTFLGELFRGLLCLNLCCFSKTKVEMLKFAELMAKCLTNNI